MFYCVVDCADILFTFLLLSDIVRTIAHYTGDYFISQYMKWKMADAFYNIYEYVNTQYFC